MVWKSLTVCFAIAMLAATPATAERQSSALQFDNGVWFDGTDFVARTVYTHNGRLSYTAPDHIHRTIDLAGGHVIPPLCEAHNHNLGGDEDESEVIRRYLDAGIYYIGILSNFPIYTGVARLNFNRPDSVDVQFANGGVTAPRAHPIPLRERLLGFGAYPGFTIETLADHAYYAIGTPADLDRIWPIALSYRPDFIKIFVMNSEDHNAPPGQTDYEGARGLHPELVRALVARSHAHGLRVFAHIETAADFRLALDAGVDVIAHLPARRVPERLTAEDARLAAESGVIIHTTAVLITRLRENNADAYETVRAAQLDNLRLLRDAGATLAIGSDLYSETSRTEAEYLRETGIFSPTQLLEMWTRNCAGSIFPDRAIGAVNEGYEASFLVLDGNPLEDWDAIDRIDLRVKDGHVLELPVAD